MKCEPHGPLISRESIAHAVSGVELQLPATSEPVCNSPFPSAAGAGKTGTGHSPQTIATLLELFVVHDGFVPGFELTAEGLNIEQLEREGFIFRTCNHLEAGCYLIGEELKRMVHPSRACPFAL